MASRSEGRHAGRACPTPPAARRVGPRSVTMGAPSTHWPAAFLDRMQALLGSELGAFLEALARPRVRGLRINPRKVTAEELAALLRLEMEPLPWCPTGYVIEGGGGL